MEYVPPSHAVIDTFARAVCQELAEKDAAYNDSETVRELAGFLRIVCAVQAKHLNKDGSRSWHRRRPDVSAHIVQLAALSLLTFHQFDVTINKVSLMCSEIICMTSVTSLINLVEKKAKKGISPYWSYGG